jgi:T-complex protein 1 subunit eta
VSGHRRGSQNHPRAARNGQNDHRRQIKGNSSFSIFGILASDSFQTHISNDGATILQLLDIVHPAAKTLVDIAKSQDAEIGDGTTSVTLLACEFMTAMKRFVEDTVHPQLIVRALRESVNLAVKRVEELALNPMSSGTAEDRRSTLIKCAQTAMSSKVLF